MNRQQGFTLMELLIGIVIVGILMAIALPAYQSYTTRAKVTEVILAANVCKSRVSEAYQSGESLPGSSNWGCEVKDPSKFVAEIATTDAERIDVTIKGLDRDVDTKKVSIFPADKDGKAISKQGDVLVQWICGSDDADVRKSLPSSCRADTKGASGGPNGGNHNRP